MGHFSFPNFKLYYRALVIKIVWYLNKGKLSDQWTRTESSERNQEIHGQFIFNKAAKIMKCSKENYNK